MLQKPTNKRKLNENVESGTLTRNFKHTKEQTFGENAEKETTFLSPSSKQSKQNGAETIKIKKEPEEIAPELVKDGKFKSVAYGNLVGYLIEAIKELKDKVEELENGQKL